VAAEDAATDALPSPTEAALETEWYAGVLVTFSLPMAAATDALWKACELTTLSLLATAALEAVLAAALSAGPPFSLANVTADSPAKYSVLPARLAMLLRLLMSIVRAGGGGVPLVFSSRLPSDCAGCD
jgi:hypothetical protein